MFNGRYIFIDGCHVSFRGYTLSKIQHLGTLLMVLYLASYMVLLLFHPIYNWFLDPPEGINPPWGIEQPGFPM